MLFLVQVRRKTALPEELLHPKENKVSKPNTNVIEIIDSDDSEAEANLKLDKNKVKSESQSNKAKIAEAFQLDEKTLQKLMDLEKTLKDKKKMPPPSAIPRTRDRSGSFSESVDDIHHDATLPGHLLRNTRATKSARPFAKSASTSNLKIKRPSSSVKSSPLVEKKTIGESSGG